ncbi:organic cation transporter protein-like [Amphiura filiformis]|uniref:organic cation transporter protein-like n=1 Tax=Amphiura filiformis TaxID=82378 RepID=UPI003B223F6B
MHFDDILLHLGAFGLYQQRIYYLASLVAIPVAWHNVGSVFLAASMDHWCTVPDMQQLNCSSTADDEICQQIKMMNIPNEAKGNQIIFDQCNRFDLPETSGMNEYDTDGNTTMYNTISCNIGWEYSRKQYKSSIVSEFDLVCDKKSLVDYANSIYFAGFLLGSIFCGTLADWLGRYPTFLICIGMTSALGTVTAFTQSYAAFVTLRFFVSVFNIGLYMMVFIIGTEFVGTSKRVIPGILIAIQFGVGYMILSVLAYFIRDWRHLQLVISLPILLFFLLGLIMHESARWLITHGKYDRAEKIIRKAAEVNKVTIPQELLNISNTKDHDEAHGKTYGYTQLDLFRTPKLRMKTLIILCNWFVISMVYYGLSLSTSGLGVNDYVAGFVSGAVEIPAILSGWFIIERWGRRNPHSIYMIVGGVACLITTMLPLGVYRTTVAMIGKFGLSAAFSIIYIYSAELFPTVVRSIGMGVSSMSARVSGVLSPIILLLGDYWQPLPLVVFGSSSVIAGLLILLLPETLKENLPETLQDGEAFGGDMSSRLPSCLSKTRDNGANDKRSQDQKPQNADGYEEVATEHV